VYPIKDFTTTITDGQKVKGVGRFHKVSVQIQELELQIGFYTLALNEMDMVLGVEWLMQLALIPPTLKNNSWNLTAGTTL
jgi:hypothetical protein